MFGILTNLYWNWCLVSKWFINNNVQENNRLEYLIPKKTSLRHRLPMGDEGFIEFVGHLLEINPKKRPSASEALKHPWLCYPYEPISPWNFILGDLKILLYMLCNNSFRLFSNIFVECPILHHCWEHQWRKKSWW